MSERRRTSEHGFTLIEVMIVVVIVAILAAVAIPSYQGQIQKTRRADAKEALMRAAAAQERYFFSHNEYTDDLTQLGFQSSLSNDAHYSLKADPVTTTAFTITATPVPNGVQLKDTQCTEFSINQLGKQEAKGSGSNPSNECW